MALLPQIPETRGRQKSRGFAGFFNVHILPRQLEGLTAELSTGMIGRGGNLVVVGGLVAASITGAATLEPEFAAPITATRDAAWVIACVETATFCSLRSCRRSGDFLRGYCAGAKFVAALP